MAPHVGRHLPNSALKYCSYKLIIILFKSINHYPFLNMNKHNRLLEKNYPDRPPRPPLLINKYLSQLTKTLHLEIYKLTNTILFFPWNLAVINFLP